MTKRGHDRGTLQRRVKVKELWNSYHKAQEADRCFGAAPTSCRFCKELDAILGGDSTSAAKTAVDTSVACMPLESGLSQEEEILDKDVEGEGNPEAEDDSEARDTWSQELFSAPEEASQSQLSEFGKAQKGEEAPGSSSSRHPNQVTPKKSGLKNGQMKSKDDECFGDDIEEIPDTDFDFEGNLALFDKAAVFEEIDTYERRSGTRSRGTPNERPARYRHDENILESEPVVYRRIVVPQNTNKEFCTDSGLVVPSVSYELHKKVLSVAEKYGLTLERRLEMTGVCASQMALSLLGGPNRLNPKNVHQRPTVALLCGPHVKGAQGISCGRHLSNHDVHVILFLPNFVKMLESITNELNLFSKTQGQQVSSVKDLPDTPVDLVINCLDCHENAFLRDQPWYKAAVDWANQNRAPVLSIDPPMSEMEQGIDAKWSLALGLPLPLGERAGRVYLCDIGIPQKVFQEVGINYHSPFGCKFVIPLHST
ncbi:Enhancer of mRNA-decapping protein 3 [Chelonia mydas]|uniref:Enhancer of mRNA-decapping protein 3 n=1 Tax=Chelonia mydas TaxID=8469 RepID=M7AZJ9_CHEMY|nr:Enhancer of mRNA-decapping protein 3 [Chelonia mydas]